MRLLQRSSTGDITLILVSDDAIPPYAILSHTWHTDNEQEVTFGDVEAGTGKDKAGYKKIVFCGEQAERDGLNISGLIRAASIN
jgi:hypothetical protein